jgi:hypothetical protein
VEAERADGGTVEVAATGIVPQDGPREIVLQRAHFDLEQGEWSLVQPAVFRWVGDQLFVDELALEDAASEGRVMVAGQLLPLSELDARVQVAALPTAELQRLIGQPERMSGQLWVDGTVRGTPGDPLVDLEFRIEDGAIVDVPLRRLEGRIALHEPGDGHRRRSDGRYGGHWTSGPGCLRCCSSTPIRCSSSSTAYPWRARFGRSSSESLPLPRSSLELRDVTGVMNAEVNLTGTADAPVVDGALTLAGGAMTVVPLNQTYSEIRPISASTVAAWCCATCARAATAGSWSAGRWCWSGSTSP